VCAAERRRLIFRNGSVSSRGVLFAHFRRHQAAAAQQFAYTERADCALQQSRAERSMGRTFNVKRCRRISIRAEPCL